MNIYQDLPIEKINQKQSYGTVIYPEIPPTEDDIYVFASHNDRYDLLALSFYGDSSLWKIISIANPTLNQNSLMIPPGVQIRIPANPSEVLQTFKSMNS